MGQRQLGDNAGELSMKFREMSDDQVFIDATSDQKAELARFIRASIDTDQVEVCTNSGIAPKSLEKIHDKVSSQIDNGEPLVLSRLEFGRICQIGDTWDAYGFQQVHPEQYGKFDVSKQIVDNIGEMYEACFE